MRDRKRGGGGVLSTTGKRKEGEEKTPLKKILLQKMKKRHVFDSNWELDSEFN